MNCLNLILEMRKTKEKKKLDDSPITRYLVSNTASSVTHILETHLLPHAQDMRCTGTQWKQNEQMIPSQGVNPDLSRDKESLRHCQTDDLLRRRQRASK